MCSGQASTAWDKNVNQIDGVMMKYMHNFAL